MSTSKSALSIVFVRKVVRVVDSEIVIVLRKTSNKDERRKIIKGYLIEKLVGNTISKEYADGHFEIRNNISDTDHLTHNEHLDTSIALTQVEELIKTSEYLGEKKVDLKSKPKSKNKYFWYFRTTVEIDGQIYDYVLNIGQSKTDGHISLYDITNYNKKNADSYRVSSTGNMRSLRKI